jgi:hypothetical protein
MNWIKIFSATRLANRYRKTIYENYKDHPVKEHKVIALLPATS